MRVRLILLCTCALLAFLLPATPLAADEANEVQKAAEAEAKQMFAKALNDALMALNKVVGLMRKRQPLAGSIVSYRGELEKLEEQIKRCVVKLGMMGGRSTFRQALQPFWKAFDKYQGVCDPFSNQIDRWYQATEKEFDTQRVKIKENHGKYRDLLGDIKEEAEDEGVLTDEEAAELIARFDAVSADQARRLNTLKNQIESIEPVVSGLDRYDTAGGLVADGVEELQQLMFDEIKGFFKEYGDSIEWDKDTEASKRLEEFMKKADVQFRRELRQFQDFGKDVNRKEVLKEAQEEWDQLEEKMQAEVKEMVQVETIEGFDVYIDQYESFIAAGNKTRSTVKTECDKWLLENEKYFAEMVEKLEGHAPGDREREEFGKARADIRRDLDQIKQGLQMLFTDEDFWAEDDDRGGDKSENRGASGKGWAKQLHRKISFLYKVQIDAINVNGGFVDMISDINDKAGEGLTQMDKIVDGLKDEVESPWTKWKDRAVALVKAAQNLPVYGKRKLEARGIGFSIVWKGAADYEKLGQCVESTAKALIPGVGPAEKAVKSMQNSIKFLQAAKDKKDMMRRFVLHPDEFVAELITNGYYDYLDAETFKEFNEVDDKLRDEVWGAKVSIALDDARNKILANIPTSTALRDFRGFISLRYHINKLFDELIKQIDEGADDAGESLAALVDATDRYYESELRAQLERERAEDR